MYVISVILAVVFASLAVGIVIRVYNCLAVSALLLFLLWVVWILGLMSIFG